MLRVVLLLLLSACANQVQVEDAGIEEDAAVMDAAADDAEVQDADPIDAAAPDADPIDAAIDAGTRAPRLILPTSGSGTARSTSYRLKASVGVSPSGVASGSGRRVRLGPGN